jgi:hypothetical protein
MKILKNDQIGKGKTAIDIQQIQMGFFHRETVFWHSVHVSFAAIFQSS